jgi:hypothetical protein
MEGQRWCHAIGGNLYVTANLVEVAVTANISAVVGCLTNSWSTLVASRCTELLTGKTFNDTLDSS